MLILAHCSSSLMLSSYDSVYADITLETVALDTPNTVAVFVTDAPARRAHELTRALQSTQTEEHSVLLTKVLSM
jgi:hypothetical protein